MQHELINTHFREADLQAAREFCKPPKPYFQNKAVTLYHGDARAVMPELSGVTAVVTDPPYELGFMGKKWDKSGVAFDPEFWDLALTCCLPGAHLLAFGGSRTFHRIACAIEDGGWEIRDTLMWLYGSGFPKSLDVSKSLDKAAGAEREVVGLDSHAPRRKGGAGFTELGEEPVQQVVTAPSTDAAKLWHGYGTALKPAFEPIILARKPLVGTVAQNVTEHGCGALAIDACRIAIDSAEREVIDNRSGAGHPVNGWGNISNLKKGEKFTSRPSGRWPANIITDGSAEVVAGFPEQSTHAGTYRNQPEGSGMFGIVQRQGVVTSSGDSGSAARFFYTAKASGSEREDNSHPTVKPMALMEYLCRLIKQPERNLVLDPFAGSGSTLLACELLGIPCIGIELDESHCEIIAKRFSKPAEPYLF